MGFEPTKLLKVYRVSNPAHSTTLPPFQNPLRRRDRIRTRNLPLYAKKGALPIELHAADLCQCLKPLTRLTGLDLPVFPTRFIRTSLTVFGHSHFGTSVARFLPSILFFGFNVDVDGALVYPINECTQNRNIKTEHEPLAVLDKFFKHKKHRRKSEVHQTIEHRSKKRRHSTICRSCF